MGIKKWCSQYKNSYNISNLKINRKNYSVSQYNLRFWSICYFIWGKIDKSVITVDWISVFKSECTLNELWFNIIRNNICT